jgi:hypothetical protein
VIRLIRVTIETAAMPVKTASWNLADIDIVEGRAVLRRRFARVAFAWAFAFAVLLVALVFGAEAAEAVPLARLGSAPLPGPALPIALAGLLGASGGLTALLWKRLLAPGMVRRSRRVE